MTEAIDINKYCILYSKRCRGIEFWTKVGFLVKYALPRYTGHPDLPGKMASPEDPGKSGSDCTSR